VRLIVWRKTSDSEALRQTRAFMASIRSRQFTQAQFSELRTWDSTLEGSRHPKADAARLVGLRERFPSTWGLSGASPKNMACPAYTSHTLRIAVPVVSKSSTFLVTIV